MIYLGSPYSHPDPAIREQRFHAACAAAAILFRAGHHAFAPVVYGHPLVAFGVPTDWPFWRVFARWFLICSNELVVLTLDGWRDSAGVQAEIELAIELGKPTRFLEPSLLDLSYPPTLAHGA